MSINQPVSHVETLREVLTRLAARKLAPTPENFGLVYREVRGDLPTPAELANPGANSIARLADVLDGLTAEHRELALLMQRLRFAFCNASTSEAEKIEEATKVIDTLAKNRGRLLYEVGQTTLKLRESVRNAAYEMAELARTVSASDNGLSGIADEMDDCVSIEQARQLLDEARRQLGDTISAVKSTAVTLDFIAASNATETGDHHVFAHLDALADAVWSAKHKVSNLLCFEVGDETSLMEVSTSYKKAHEGVIVGKLDSKRGAALFGDECLAEVVTCSQMLQAKLASEGIALKFGTAKLPPAESLKTNASALQVALDKALLVM